jgi:uncharacterized protein YkwD
MNFKLRSRHVLIAIFVFFLFITPLSPEVTLAQESEGTPTGLGRPPEVTSNWDADRSRQSASADADFYAFLPVAVEPSSAAKTYSSCATNTQETKLASMAKVDPNQERPKMNCHPILSQVAHARAKDMAQKGYFSHITPDGYGPNFLVAQAGYDLPEWWPDSLSENYIESIAGGYPTAQAAWDAWLHSASHRTHVLGENDFWAEQTNYGMGYVYIEGSPYGHYWVFITAPPEE